MFLFASFSGTVNLKLCVCCLSPGLHDIRGKMTLYYFCFYAKGKQFHQGPVSLRRFNQLS